jgi:hypothetical protein
MKFISSDIMYKAFKCSLEVFYHLGLFKHFLLELFYFILEITLLFKWCIMINLFFISKISSQNEIKNQKIDNETILKALHHQLVFKVQP